EAVVYSSAVKEDNPELQAAHDANLPIYKRAEMLAFLMSLKKSVGVAGSHGKTTTSGMMSLMLENCGLDPTIIIGGTLPQIQSNAKSGKGDFLIAEADESDGTFLLLHPKIAVITNIERDHLDHYQCLDNIVEAFETYLRQLPADGMAIVCLDCQQVVDLQAKVPCNYLTYALTNPNADFTARDIRHNQLGVAAEIYHQGNLLGTLQLQVPGEHNISNALASIALGISLGLPFSQLAKALLDFHGTGRRYELLGEVDGIKVIDDYAHHPTEIKATIKAAKDLGAERLITVFQPHRYTRTQALYKEFAGAFALSDVIIINEIYGAFEKPIPGVTAHLLVDEIKATTDKEYVEYAATLDDTLDAVRHYAKSGDVVLVMGAGNIRQIGERFVEERQSR
ncbi:MAG: UDP-N-acetylmuramate--L-alanine ligase, partial [Clostridiales bacterium]